MIYLSFEIINIAYFNFDYGINWLFTLLIYKKMNAYDTLHFIDNLLLELWYTDENKENFDKDLYNWIENLYWYLDSLEIENKNLIDRVSELENKIKK